MNQPNINIIIIKGAPASGKSKTAKELAKLFPNGVRIEVDTLRSMVISVDWTNQEEHINILNISIDLILEFYNLGFKPIIVVDTFSGDKLNAYFEKLNHLNQNLRIAIFGLYTTNDEIRKRLELRSDDKFKDFMICSKLNSDTIKYKHIKEIQIETTHLLPEETAKIIYNILNV